MNPYERIEKQRQELLAQLKQLPQDLLHLPESEGKWSIIQVLNHLITSERGSLLYCKKKMLAGDQLENTTMLGKLKMAAFNQFLRFPFKYKAPSFLNAPDNAPSYEEVAELWNASRKDLLEFIQHFPENYRSKSIYKHPYAGRVNLNGMLHFFAAHQRHHEFQIQRILKKIKIK